MKKLLFDYEFKRNFWQASIFYIVHMFYFFVFAYVYALVVYLLVGENYKFISDSKNIEAGALVFLVSIFVLKKKRLLGENKFFGLAVVSGWLAYSTNYGVAIPFLITSYLTTIDQSKQKIK